MNNVMPYLKNDRAYCMNGGSSPLRLGWVYHVAETRMSPSGAQSLGLAGVVGWWDTCRFVRIPDPTPRKWPNAGCETRRTNP